MFFKYNFDSRKCDLFGIGDIASAGISSGASIYNNERSLAEQASLLNKTQQWNTKERYEAQQWADQQRIMSQGFQTSEREAAQRYNTEMWEMNNEYNAPKNLLSRLDEAGINPNGLLHQISGLSSSAPSVGSSGAPSTPAAHFAGMGVPSVPNLENFGTAFANAFKTMAEAKKAGVDTEKIRAMWHEELKFLQLDNRHKEIENEFLPELNNAKVKESINHALEMEKQAFLFEEQGKTQDAVRKLDEAQEEYYKAASYMSRSQGKLFEEKSKTWHEEAMSQITANKASASANNAQAGYVREITSQQKDMHEYNVNLAANKSQLSQAELQKTSATLLSEINYSLANYEFLDEKLKEDLRKIKSEATMSEFRADMRWVDWALSTLERVNDGVTQWIPLTQRNEKNSPYNVETIRNNYDSYGNLKGWSETSSKSWRDY